MNKELIINVAPSGVEIALLEDKKLVELHNEKADASFAVGDLYLGKVKKLIPGLNAAFVDVGFEKDAFLHYTDLSPYARSIIKFTQLAMNDKEERGFDFAKFQSEPEIVKTGKINEVLNAWHHFGDHCILRRELVEMKMLTRTAGGAEYRKVAARPDAEVVALLSALRQRSA